MEKAIISELEAIKAKSSAFAKQTVIPSDVPFESVPGPSFIQPDGEEVDTITVSPEDSVAADYASGAIESLYRVSSNLDLVEKLQPHFEAAVQESFNTTLEDARLILGSIL